MAETTNGSVERNTNFTLWQRIHACVSELGVLEKDGTATIYSKRTNKEHSYDYISHDAVASAAKTVFVKYGIGVLPTVTGRKDDGNRCELDVRVTFVNIDETSQTLVMDVVGYGVDNQDKGPGKAFSYAMKYAYLKLLMLNSADDIEQDQIDHKPSLPDTGELDEARAKTVTFSETWANNLRDQLEAADSITQLDALQRDNKTALMEAPEVTRDYFISHIEAKKERLHDGDLPDTQLKGDVA